MSTSACILGCEGLTLSASEKSFFAEARPWGFILFARNIKDAAQVLALTEDLRAAVGWNAPVLIDQEGGRVQRLRGPIWREWHPPLDTIEAARDPARVMYLRSYLIGHELRDVGVDVQCGPTCDVARDGTHPFLKNRLYGHDADTVIRHAQAVADGLGASGVACVAKHIPGHGLGTVDSHHDLPRVRADRATLDAVDFKVFREMTHLQMAMTAHVVFEDIDPDLPATQSPAMIDVIRRNIGFSGLLMTDDLSMNALPGSIGQRAEASRAAGCDVILHCNGERPEMEEVLANCGALEDQAKVRADLADAQRPKRQQLDIGAVEQELSDLLGGKVYVNDSRV